MTAKGFAFGNVCPRMAGHPACRQSKSALTQSRGLWLIIHANGFLGHGGGFLRQQTQGCMWAVLGTRRRLPACLSWGHSENRGARLQWGWTHRSGRVPLCEGVERKRGPYET